MKNQEQPNEKEFKVIKKYFDNLKQEESNTDGQNETNGFKKFKNKILKTVKKKE